jgi:hypothetical protein
MARTSEDQLVEKRESEESKITEDLIKQQDMSLVQLGIHFSFLAMELDWHIKNGISALLTTILN